MHQTWNLIPGMSIPSGCDTTRQCQPCYLWCGHEPCRAPLLRWQHQHIGKPSRIRTAQSWVYGLLLYIEIVLNKDYTENALKCLCVQFTVRIKMLAINGCLENSKNRTGIKFSLQLFWLHRIPRNGCSFFSNHPHGSFLGTSMVSHWTQWNFLQ